MTNHDHTFFVDIDSNNNNRLQNNKTQKQIKL
jgi:hypothetical protein